MDNILLKYGFVLKTMDEKDLNDSFFDSFKIDYPEFEEWFCLKSSKGDLAFYYYDNNHNIIGFVKLKIEKKSKKGLFEDDILKICSLKLESISTKNANDIFNEIHLFAKSHNYNIYCTCFEKHKKLINKLLKLNYKKINKNEKGEIIFIKKII